MSFLLRSALFQESAKFSLFLFPVVRLVRFQKRAKFFLSVFEIFFVQKVLRQRDILKYGVLRKQIKRLEHQPEMQALFADILHRFFAEFGSVEQFFAV